MAKYIVLGFCVTYYAVTLLLLCGIRFTTKDLCLCGIAVAMTLVLDSVRIPLPTGATFPLCSPLPLMVLAIMTDHRLGVISGWVCGIMAMLLIPVWQLVHWGQFFVEHMICFSCLGYVSIFGTDKRWKLLCGLLLASVLKICGHLIAVWCSFRKTPGTAGVHGVTVWRTIYPRMCPCVHCVALLSWHCL